MLQTNVKVTVDGTGDSAGGGTGDGFSNKIVFLLDKLIGSSLVGCINWCNGLCQIQGCVDRCCSFW